MNRLEHLRDQLAALVSYGKGDSPEAETVRAEIGLIEAETAARDAVQQLSAARAEAAEQPTESAGDAAKNNNAAARLRSLRKER